MGLPEELRKTVERRLNEEGFHSYKGLAQWIRQQGHQISMNSLQRFAIRLTRDSATAQRGVKAEALPGGAGVTTEGLMQMAREKLSSALAEINQLQQGDTSRLAHAVAHLTQAAISLRRWTDELEQRTEERERVAPDAKSMRRGLSPETSQALRNALLGIAPFNPEQVASQKAATSRNEASTPPARPVADEFEKGDETGRTGSAAPFKGGDGFDDDGTE
jgi:hypothetical protein